MLRAVSISLRNLANIVVKPNPVTRNFSVTPSWSLKEIREKQDGNTLIIEGVDIISPRENRLVKSSNSHGACILCSLELDVKHTDVLIIKQFIDHNAKLYPRKMTGLCRWQQRKMKYLLEMATRAGLINPLIANQPIPDYQRGWRKFNTYFDESEIPPSKTELRMQKARQFEEAYQIAKAERDAHEEMLRIQREAKRKQ